MGGGRLRLKGHRGGNQMAAERTLLIRNADLLVTMDAQRREIADGAVFIAAR